LFAEVDCKVEDKICLASSTLLLFFHATVDDTVYHCFPFAIASASIVHWKGLCQVVKEEAREALQSAAAACDHFYFELFVSWSLPYLRRAWSKAFVFPREDYLEFEGFACSVWIFQ